MSRRVQIRVSYSADATYLSRLLQAVERDNRLSPELKGRIIGNLQVLISLLIIPLVEDANGETQ